MTFIENAEQVARGAMREISPDLVDKFVSLIRFLSLHPDAASALRGKFAPLIGTEEYVRRQARAFSQARNPRAPKPSATVPDEMVSVILVSYFGIESADVDRIKKEHLLSMNAENMVGDLLERYLASVLEPEGWIWCSGAVVKAVDFIKPPVSTGSGWRLLQVKNRDNSENSSSSAIRTGTNIEKWFRSFSKTGSLNWDAFPDATLKTILSENEFRSFVRKHFFQLKALKK
ncbi:MAG: SinI family restriction endonuclease [Synergistaceae bacterium]|jgi:hypothetical protein|nr:SinI family restriction endonuclease [Synergistaceae bacterium]